MKMEVNEAIIDVEIAKAEFEGTYFEGFMPILVAPIVTKKQWNISRPKSPPKGAKFFDCSILL